MGRHPAEVSRGHSRKETSHPPEAKGKDGSLTDKLKGRMLEGQRNWEVCNKASKN